jgi:hypothetical protein
MGDKSRSTEARRLNREAGRRLLFYIGFGALAFASVVFGFDRGLGGLYLLWGSFLSVMYASLTLHPRLKSSWAPRFEAFGINLVALGALLVSGLPEGAWWFVAAMGVCLLMGGFYLLVARDAGLWPFRVTRSAARGLPVPEAVERASCDLGRVRTRSVGSPR